MHPCRRNSPASTTFAFPRSRSPVASGSFSWPGLCPAWPGALGAGARVPGVKSSGDYVAADARSMTGDNYTRVLNLTGGQAEPLPDRERWAALQEWRQAFAVRLHAATGRWK